MIDTLFRLLPLALEQDSLQRLKLTPHQFGVVTLHRPSNVDDATILSELLQVLAEVSRDLPLVFPIHPRTKEQIDDCGLNRYLETVGILQLPPLGYIDFLSLTSQAKVIVTDSGGLQEESTRSAFPA